MIFVSLRDQHYGTFPLFGGDVFSVADVVDSTSNDIGDDLEKILINSGGYTSSLGALEEFGELIKAPISVYERGFTRFAAS